jgi:hypothetical protein
VFFREVSCDFVNRLTGITQEHDPRNHTKLSFKGEHEKNKSTKPPSEEYSRFESLARQIMAVPKSEIDKRQAEYEKKKAAKKRKAA